MNIIKIRDWMSSPVVTCSAEDTIIDAVKLMTKHKIGALIAVKDEMKLQGIITERDVMQKVLAKDLNYRTVKVSDAMTTDVYTVSTNATLLDISKIMNKHRIRHAIVMENDKVVGIVTARDLIELVSS